ncbi:hypothetical protein C8R44DRAFT_892229 [Mycena epipterygia]|nr:hypothetical protein C8R44DRAFT_892229 [Mycena epipterygia]
MRSSQLAQELVDHIIDFLHDSPEDWPACALVSRAWVYTAQHHIFRCIYFTSPVEYENRWARFLETSETSPHLIRHIRQLDVNQFVPSMETFIAICDFPFTHLDSSAYSPLLADNLLHFPPIEHSSASIQLESLDLREVPAGLSHWFIHPLCLFDFSGLTALSIPDGTELLNSQKFAPALRRIQTLVLTPPGTGPKAPFDLSSLPSLVLLRVHIYPIEWPWVFATLSTIKPSNCILKIVIVGQELWNRIAPEQLDSELSGLPISPITIIEFELYGYRRESIPHLPLLSSKHRLRRVDYDRRWFEVRAFFL